MLELLTRECWILLLDVSSQDEEVVDPPIACLVAPHHFILLLRQSLWVQPLILAHFFFEFLIMFAELRVLLHQLSSVDSIDALVPSDCFLFLDRLSERIDLLFLRFNLLKYIFLEILASL